MRKITVKFLPENEKYFYERIELNFLLYIHDSILSLQQIHKYRELAQVARTYRLFDLHDPSAGNTQLELEKK